MIRLSEEMIRQVDVSDIDVREVSYDPTKPSFLVAAEFLSVLDEDRLVFLDDAVIAVSAWSRVQIWDVEGDQTFELSPGDFDPDVIQAGRLIPGIGCQLEGLSASRERWTTLVFREPKIDVLGSGFSKRPD